LISSHPDIQQNPVKVKIFVLGGKFRGKKLLDNVVLKDNSWHEYRYDLSHEARDNILLMFEVNRTWKPSKMTDSSDSRELGIGLGTLRFVDDPFLISDKTAGSERLISVLTKSDWKGPNGGNLLAKGRCWIDTFLPTRRTVFNVSAKGERAKDEWPYMIVWFNDEMIGGK
jgi:hypothetical protein